MKSEVQQTLGVDLIFFNSTMNFEEREEKKQKIKPATPAAIVLHASLILGGDTETFWKPPCNHGFGHRTTPHPPFGGS
jgi:hypothetical protein